MYAKDTRSAGRAAVRPLTADQEEIALRYAALVAKEAPVLKSPAFLRNFSRDWKAVLGSDREGEDWDFLRLHRDAERKKPKLRPPLSQEEEKSPPQRATIDGEAYPVTNGVVQRPGVYVARTDAHPLHGRIRTRVRPEDVTLNLSRGAPTPPPYPESARAWHQVIHRPRVSWLARWRDPLSREFKYMTVRTAALETQTKYDALKFAAAERLGREMPRARRRLRRVLESPAASEKTKRTATCAALVLEFGIRRGGGNRTVTTGATTLRAKHVLLSSAGGRRVRLRFTGKDGVAFDATRSVTPEVYASLKRARERAASGGGEEEPLWEDVSPAAVNAFMDEHVLRGLTSKVVRTHIATSIARRRLLAGDRRRPRGDPLLLREMPNAALLEVAWTLNHRKNGGAEVGDDTTASSSFLCALRRFWKVAAATTTATKNSDAVVRDLKAAAGRLGLAPTTSKMNYVDPAVMLRFAEQHDLPVSVLYSPAQMARLVPRQRHRYPAHKAPV